MAIDLKVDETMTLSVHETIRLDLPTSSGTEKVTITLEQKHGQVARLRIRADERVRITRPAKKEFCAAT